MLSALDGAVPGGDSGTRIGEQVIYLGDDSRKHQLRLPVGKWDKEIKAAYKAILPSRLLLWHLGLYPLGDTIGEE